MSHPQYLLFFMDKKLTLLPDKEYTIGRHPDCTIVLEEPRVSRQHAKIYFHEGFFHIQDLSSTNGLWLNGKQITQAPLRSRDSLSIGTFHLVFYEKDQENEDQNQFESMLRDTLALENRMARILDQISNKELKEQIFDLKKVINHSRDRMNQLAHVDQLTGLYNRRFFDQSLLLEIERALRYQLELSLVIMDIDHFKDFNDTHGHQKGDEVLKEVAKWVTENTRVNDFAARYGGEEFVIILPGTSYSGALALGEKIRKAIERESEKALGLSVSASFGISLFHEGKDNEESLLARADQCLYLAKERGRNTVVGEKN